MLTASVGPVPVPLDGPAAVLVPVPANRPAVAEALLAQADAEVEAEADEIEQAILSPEAAAALEQSEAAEAAATAPAAEVPATAPTQVAALPAPANKPVHSAVQSSNQVAMLSMPKPATRPVDFGDAFDAPAAQPQDKGIETGMPAKGKRPSVLDAATANRAVTGAPVLTTNMLSTWALNRDRADTTAKTTKAPRLGARALAADPTWIYAGGFEKGAPTVDPGRFGQPRAKP